jgi:integrase
MCTDPTSLALAAGVGISTVSRGMGHGSIATTFDLYGHLYTGKNDDAIARLLERT